jgi:seryl-tRNA synthetase
MADSTPKFPVTNLYRDDDGETFDGENLPVHHCAYTPCLRREAVMDVTTLRGSLIRLHQFNRS